MVSPDADSAKAVDKHADQWNLSPADAVKLQRRLAEAVVSKARFRIPRVVAGVDVGFPERGRLTRACAVAMSFPQLELLDQHVTEQPTRFPYIPGLLSFREVPAIMAALRGLKVRPDVVLCDGHGLAHPRRFGVACHLGVVLGCATIGVGKSRLCGTFEQPGNLRGAQSRLVQGDETIGAVLRTRTGVKPVFVSVGHQMTLKLALSIVLDSAPKYRLPEPIRAADRLASGRERTGSAASPRMQPLK